MNFPTLYRKTKGGGIQQKKISTEGAKIITEWGLINGAKQIAEVIATPKNVGRSNSTTAEEQAELEATAMWKFERDRRYRETVEDAKNIVFLPMLARSKVFTRSERIKFPVDVQPKYDGVRCLAFWNDDETEVNLISRNGKPYAIPRIKKALEEVLPKGTVLDGELYAHGYGFQTVVSWIKKLQRNTELICYHTYDCPEYLGNSGETWENRYLDLLRVHSEVFAKRHQELIVLTPTVRADSVDKIFEIHGQHLENGFEGAILRQLSGLYLMGARAHSELLKVKDFQEDDFEVTGWKVGLPGTKEADAIIWECKTKEGNLFTVRPKGPITEREAILTKAIRNPKSFVGKLYSVKFQEYSDDRIPRFPVGLGFKEDR